MYYLFKAFSSCLYGEKRIDEEAYSLLGSAGGLMSRLSVAVSACLLGIGLNAAGGNSRRPCHVLFAGVALRLEFGADHRHSH